MRWVLDAMVTCVEPAAPAGTGVPTVTACSDVTGRMPVPPASRRLDARVRCVGSLCVVSSLAVNAAGCSLSPGQPWGHLSEAAATASFALPDERRDGDGRLLTSKSYAATLDIVAVSVSALTLDQAAPDVGAFDPAAPPAGFSLCHNGHCHADDGRLVDYEQVALESGAGEAGASLTLGIDNTTGLRQEPIALPLQCEAPCTFARGDVVTASLFVREVHVRALIFDALDQDRVPAGGLPIDIVLAPRAPTRTPIDDVSMERFEPIDWQLDASFALTPSLLDAFDFEDGIEDEALAEAAFAVSSQSTLTIALTPASGEDP